MKRFLLFSIAMLCIATGGGGAWAQALDDYRTAASGDWNANATWERYNGSVWEAVTGVAPLTIPASTDGVITILNGHTVTVTAAASIDQGTIQAGGQVTVNSGQTWTVAAGAGTDLTVNGTVSNAGTITTTGTISFGASSTYQHNQDGGTIPTATWNATSTCNITGLVSTDPSGDGQAFGNLTYDCPGMTGVISMASSGLSVAGNFQVLNTGSSRLQMTLGSFTVTGNCTISDDFLISNTTNRTLTVTGNVSVTGGTLDMCNGTTGDIGTLNVSGNFSHTGGTITETALLTGSGLIEFDKAGIQTYTSGGTISNTVNFTVNSGSTLQMATDATTVDGDGTFTLSSGATLGITSPDGITTVGTALGNIRTTTARSFNAGANYLYNGSANQNTGTGLFAAGNLTGDLIINNPGNTITLSAARTIASGGLVNLTDGTFVAGTNLTMATTSSITRSGGSMTGTPQGAGVYNVTYTGNSKTTGSELDGTGLNDLMVSLTAGQTLTLGAAITADGTVTIGVGSTLDVSASNFAISVGNDWTNNGTFSAGSGTVTFTGGLAQDINASQTFNNVIINKSANSLTGNTALTVNDLTLTLGTFNSPATLNINGDFLHTAGTFNDGTNVNIKGNWTRNGGTYTASGGTTATFNGTTTQTVSGAAATTFQNLTINSGGTVLLTAGVTIANGYAVSLVNGTFGTGTNLTMTTTSSITRSGGSMTGTPQGAGVYNVTYTGNSKTTGTELDGTGRRSITLNLTAGESLTLDAPRTIPTTGTLTLTSGKLILGANNLTITSATAGAISGASSTNYIVTNSTGFLVRDGIAAPATALAFPVGNSAYNPVTLKQTTDVTARTYSVLVRDGVVPASNNDPAALQRTWVITQSPVVSAVNVTFTLQWNSGEQGTTFTAVNTPNRTTTLSKPWWNNPGGWLLLSSATYGDITAITSTGFPAIATVVTKLPFGGSPWTIALFDGALPIQLSSFTATLQNNSVRLNWTTISEVNNYGFYVQKKRLAETAWNEIENSFIPGYGTTNLPQQYSFIDNSSVSGVWQYRLRQVDLDGTVNYTEPIQVDVLTDVREVAPMQFALLQNYPNPFNPSTEIKFSVEATDYAKLDVYNALGQKVATLFDEVAQAGQYYKVRFNASSLSSGVYFYRLNSGKKSELKKLLLLK